ncbi:MAG: hypothetical protein K2X87_12335, partial [Gemmataceae bacterium]|nr:hypothetical protein [Gemmataceae bacterium]
MPPVAPSPASTLPDALPGDQVVPTLRAWVRGVATAGAPPWADPAERIAAVLEQWGAFDRDWVARLLPPLPPPGGDPGGAAGRREDLDPKTTAGVRLQDVWAEVVDGLVARGRRLRGANALPQGVEEVLSDAYRTAARLWPGFGYQDPEHTVRWLLAILRNLLHQAVARYRAERRHHAVDLDAVALADRTATEATRSKAEDRALMAARVLCLNGLFPPDCRATDLEDRVHGAPTMHLLVVADSLEVVLRLDDHEPPGERRRRRVWGLRSLRRAGTAEAVALVGADTAGAVNTVLHRT